jgi:hypothetical protein
MLATPTLFSIQSYMPQRPSPLSPRSANAGYFQAQPLFFGMSGSENESTKPSKISTYAQRQIKPTPFSSRNRDEQRERRRDLFLKRVEQTRDDKKWEGRSEEILRCDHFSQQRRWKEVHESQVNSDVNVWEAQFEEPTSTASMQYDPAHPQSSFQIYSDPQLDEVDLVAQQEQLEIQEWSEFLAQRSTPAGEAHFEEQHADNSQMTDYDDDEYDSVFMELIDQQLMPDEQQQQSQHQQEQEQQHHDDADMDLSS